jgi:hypothetical protein
MVTQLQFQKYMIMDGKPIIETIKSPQKIKIEKEDNEISKKINQLNRLSSEVKNKLSNRLSQKEISEIQSLIIMLMALDFQLFKYNELLLDSEIDLTLKMTDLELYEWEYDNISVNGFFDSIINYHMDTPLGVINHFISTFEDAMNTINKNK